MSTIRTIAFMTLALGAFTGAAMATEADDAPLPGANSQMAPEGAKPAAPTALYARISAGQLADVARQTGNAALMASAASALRDAPAITGGNAMTYVETGGIDDGSAKTDAEVQSPATLFNEARKLAGQDTALQSFIDAQEAAK
jgi:hypothetical protein